MPGSKTWIVNSETSRHPELDGETVPLHEPFSNGMQYPGDPEGGPDQTAGCTCTMDIEMEAGAVDYGSDTRGAFEQAREWRAAWEASGSQADIDKLSAGPYVGLNGILRGVSEVSPELRAEALKDSQLLDKLINSSGFELPQDTVVYRGVPSDVWSELRIGSRISDKGFLYGSLDSTWSERFAEGGGRLFRLHVPSGTRAMVPSNVIENEIVMNRELEWTVVSEKNSVVDLELVR